MARCVRPRARAPRCSFPAGARSASTRSKRRRVFPRAAQVPHLHWLPCAAADPGRARELSGGQLRVHRVGLDMQDAVSAFAIGAPEQQAAAGGDVAGVRRADPAACRIAAALRDGSRRRLTAAHARRSCRRRRGDHDHRQGVSFGAQLAQHVQAIHVRAGADPAESRSKRSSASLRRHSAPSRAISTCTVSGRIGEAARAGGRRRLDCLRRKVLQSRRFEPRPHGPAKRRARSSVSNTSRCAWPLRRTRRNRPA